MQKLKQIPKRVHHFLIGLVLTAVLGVLAFAVVNTYTAYTDMVVQQQQQYLLVTARAVSKTLSLYISGQLRDIEILTARRASSPSLKITTRRAVTPP